jgi:hypothetical protein
VADPGAERILSFSVPETPWRPQVCGGELHERPSTLPQGLIAPSVRPDLLFGRTCVSQPAARAEPAPVPSQPSGARGRDRSTRRVADMDDEPSRLMYE